MLSASSNAHSAYSHQLWWNNAWPASDPRKSPKLRSSGGIGPNGAMSIAASASANGRTHHQSRPPRRVAVCGARSHSRSRTLVHDGSTLRSRISRIPTRIACHSRPSVNAHSNDTKKRSLEAPSPATAGPTTHASTAIGKAAAAQTASTIRREY